MVEMPDGTLKPACKVTLKKEGVSGLELLGRHISLGLKTILAYIRVVVITAA